MYWLLHVHKGGLHRRKCKKSNKTPHYRGLHQTKTGTTLTATRELDNFHNHCFGLKKTDLSIFCLRQDEPLHHTHKQMSRLAHPRPLAFLLSFYFHTEHAFLLLHLKQKPSLNPTLPYYLSPFCPLVVRDWNYVILFCPSISFNRGPRTTPVPPPSVHQSTFAKTVHAAMLNRSTELAAGSRRAYVVSHLLSLHTHHLKIVMDPKVIHMISNCVFLESILQDSARPPVVFFPNSSRKARSFSGSPPSKQYGKYSWRKNHPAYYLILSSKLLSF